MAGRSGPIGTFVRVVFSLPFVGAGLFVVIASVRGATSGGMGGRAVGVLVGGLFAWAGGRQIWNAVRGTRSRESLAAPDGPSAVLTGVAPQLTVDYRSAARGTRTAREVYAPILDTAPLPKPVTRPGRALAVALGVAPDGKSVSTTIFGIVWTTLSMSMFVGMLAAKVWAGAAFLSLFVAVGFAFLYSGIPKLLSRFKLPQVELAEEPVFLGDEILAHIEQRGPARVSRLRVEVVCREQTKMSVGTDTIRETHDAYSQELLDEPGRKLGVGERWSHELRFTLPAQAPHSFVSPNNTVGWFLRVRAEIAGWPDYDDSFELRALPRIPS